MYFKIIKPITFSLLFASISLGTFAQEDDLLKELEEETKDTKQFELPAFKAMQIGNLQSTKLADKGDFYLIVAHRFGSIKGGIEEFFGLDQANAKIQLAYGIIDGLQVGLSRDSYDKTYSGDIKFRIAKQSNKMPFNIVGYASTHINTALKKATYPNMKFEDRLSYSSQLLISRRMSKRFSLQIAPIYVRHNLQDLNYTYSHTYHQFLLAVGGRFKFSKRLSLNVDYAYNFSKDKKSSYKNPLTVGLDIDTGGHVFQLVFSNARGTNDSGFLTKSLGDWTKGDISFGFNIVRVF